MAVAEELLERMRGNPRYWRIGTGESKMSYSVCKGFGIAGTPPRKGSHYKAKHENMAEMLTIPAHRPIKPVHARNLVNFIDAVRGSAA
jgi:hypothetical protein